MAVPGFAHRPPTSLQNLDHTAAGRYRYNINARQMQDFIQSGTILTHPLEQSEAKGTVLHNFGTQAA